MPSGNELNYCPVIAIHLLLLLLLLLLLFLLLLLLFLLLLLLPPSSSSSSFSLSLSSSCAFDQSVSDSGIRLSDLDLGTGRCGAHVPPFPTA